MSHTSSSRARPHTAHATFGGSGVTGSRSRLLVARFFTNVYRVLIPQSSFCVFVSFRLLFFLRKILRASSVIKPPTMAFVVATACTMFPATPLTSNGDCASMR